MKPPTLLCVFGTPEALRLGSSLDARGVPANVVTSMQDAVSAVATDPPETIVIVLANASGAPARPLHEWTMEAWMDSGSTKRFRIETMLRLPRPNRSGLRVEASVLERVRGESTGRAGLGKQANDRRLCTYRRMARKGLKNYAGIWHAALCPSVNKCPHRPRSRHKPVAYLHQRAAGPMSSLGSCRACCCRPCCSCHPCTRNRALFSRCATTSDPDRCPKARGVPRRITWQPRSARPSRRPMAARSP